MNVLVVDDDAVMVELVQYFLEEDGMCVKTATSSADAMLLLQQEKIDLVLSDLVMPGGGARRLLSYIQATKPDLPMIVMSGYGSSDLNFPSNQTRGFWRKGEAMDSLIALVKSVSRTAPA